MPMTRNESRMSASAVPVWLRPTSATKLRPTTQTNRLSGRPQGLDNRIVPVGFRFFELGVQAAEHPALDNINQPGHDDEAGNP